MQWATCMRNILRLFISTTRNLFKKVISAKYQILTFFIALINVTIILYINSTLCIKGDKQEFYTNSYSYSTSII